MIASQCIEWAIVLATLLLDTSVVSRIVEEVKGHQDVEWAAEVSVITRTVQGYKDLCNWAEDER